MPTLKLEIEIEESDVREAIATIPAAWFDSPSSAVMKVAKAVKNAYERRLVDRGRPTFGGEPRRP